MQTSYSVPRTAKTQQFWHLDDVERLTSPFAFDEARVNPADLEQRTRLEHLGRRLRLVPDIPINRPLPEDVRLHEKDRPILLAAIEHKSTHLSPAISGILARIWDVGRSSRRDSHAVHAEAFLNYQECLRGDVLSKAAFRRSYIGPTIRVYIDAGLRVAAALIVGSGGIFKCK